ncbi:hypothetical protein E2C01_101117 [Portunus trituberculatus]|uniref:Uncharacterized protein n=1 Tax=Portunus trituberculatus TaxID=210409 RepID=A0A5B7KFA3_PORTR|nr:hypothetical protein [Portunus trituberculatus]
MSSPSRSMSGRVGGVSGGRGGGSSGGGSGARSLMLQSPLNHSFSLENLEDFDLERTLHLHQHHQHPHPHLCHSHQAPPTPPMSRSPMASTPISDEHRGAPMLPPPCSPVRDVNMVGRRGSVLCQGVLYRPMSGRIPGAVQGPRPIRCPPAALGPKWRLFKRRTCPELLKTRSSDNLFR